MLNKINIIKNIQSVLRKHLFKIVIFFVLVITALIFLSPLLWIFFTSLKDNQEIYHLPLTIIPHRVVFLHYTHIFTDLPDFFVYFSNSIKVTITTVVIVLFLSGLGGYAFGRRDFKGKNITFAFILILLGLPYALYLIPIYIMEDIASLLNTNWGLILPYIALNLPLGIFIMRGSFKEFPSELEDAAIIDGCRQFQMWRRVLLPLVAPGMAVVAVVTFVAVWEEFMFARTLMQSNIAQTLPVGIPLLKEEAMSWAYGTLSAVLILSLVPIIVVFLVLQKYFIQGLLKGSLKG